MWHADDEEGDEERGAEEGGCHSGAGVEIWWHSDLAFSVRALAGRARSVEGVMSGEEVVFIAVAFVVVLGALWN